MGLHQVVSEAMTRKRLAKIKKVLDGMLRTLRSREAGLVAGLGVHRGAGDLGDAARDTEDGAELVQGIERASDSIAEVEEALERLEAGTYGLCVDCGKAINPDRLAELPAAARCVKCQGRPCGTATPPTRMGPTPGGA